MEMSVSPEGSVWHRIVSDEGLTAISHYFVMDWASVWMDIVFGLLIAAQSPPGYHPIFGEPFS